MRSRNENCLKTAYENGQNSLFYTNLSFVLMSVNTGAYIFESPFILFWLYYLSIIINKYGVSQLEKSVYSELCSFLNCHVIINSDK